MKTADKPQAASCNERRSRHASDNDRFSRSSKITPAHLQRLAVVYVRQSSPQQVLHNRESTARQYALADHAEMLGWPAERVMLIDEDQGQTGSVADNRNGFQRLLSEVTLEHVGIVLGLEMSRLARSSKDWHHLFELCGIFETLLADQEGIYDANDPNDRLILGLKGIMSEVELQTMRNRLERGRINKAERGDLFYSVPLGYIILPTGEVAFDPDEQARSVVQMLFEKFDEIGSVCGVFRWLIDHNVELPFRLRRGPRKGQLEFRRPVLATLGHVFRHPIYAGAYAYGRRRSRSTRGRLAGQRQRGGYLPSEEWPVLIRDRLPAYITWDRYVQNQERIKQNCTRADTHGATRNGSALLCGLVTCGLCNWRMQVSYRTVERPNYRCLRYTAERTENACFGVSANVLDEFVSGQVLQMLEPAALELSLRAQRDLRRERERLHRQEQQTLKRARYDADLAERRYRAVDPENRLVAATLESQWEAALRKERELREEFERTCRQTRPGLSADEEASILALSSDIATLWHSSETTSVQRQEIIRCLVERVVVRGDRHSEHIEVVIQWAGGYESHHALVRPVRWYDQLRDFDQLAERVVELHKAGRTAEETANALNAEGFTPIDPSKTFNRDMVRDIRIKLGLRGDLNTPSLLRPGEARLRDVARELDMPWQTLREWTVRGWVHGRQTRGQKLWIIWVDDDELVRLKKLRASTSHGVLGYAPHLTVPKARPQPE